MVFGNQLEFSSYVLCRVILRKVSLSVTSSPSGRWQLRDEYIRHSFPSPLIPRPLSFITM